MKEGVVWVVGVGRGGRLGRGVGRWWWGGGVGRW